LLQKKKNFKLIINNENYELSSFIKIIDIETGEGSNTIINIFDPYQDDDSIEIKSEGPEIKMKIEETLEIRLR